MANPPTLVLFYVIKIVLLDAWLPHWQQNCCKGRSTYRSGSDAVIGPAWMTAYGVVKSADGNTLRKECQFDSVQQ